MADRQCAEEDHDQGDETGGDDMSHMLVERPRYEQFPPGKGVWVCAIILSTSNEAVSSSHLMTTALTGWRCLIAHCENARLRR